MVEDRYKHLFEHFSDRVAQGYSNKGEVMCETSH